MFSPKSMSNLGRLTVLIIVLWGGLNYFSYDICNVFALVFMALQKGLHVLESIRISFIGAYFFHNHRSFASLLTNASYDCRSIGLEVKMHLILISTCKVCNE